MQRSTNFLNLWSHPWYKKLMYKIDVEQGLFIGEFIRDNDHLSKGDFELKVNRLFVDDKIKPKNHTLVVELLLACNN